MKIRGLLVPGTGATVLRDSLGHNLGNPARPDTAFGLAALAVRSPQEAVDTLAMEHRAGQWSPLRSSVKDGRSILPGHVLTALYTQLPDDWAHYMYDWRADIRHNAERLVRWLSARTRDGERWHMVAHSQGAVVAVLAAKLMEDEERFARHVASLRLVAPPLAGTVVSARWMIDGLAPAADASFMDRALDLFGQVMPSRRAEGESDVANLQEAVRTWPALYQMLPAWRAARNEGGDLSLLAAATWAGHDAIDPALLERARETRAMLADPLSHLAGVDVRLVMTAHRDTPVAMAHRDGRLLSEVVAHEPGDTLIPRRRTLDHYDGALDGHVDTVEGAEELHSKLLSDARVWKHAGPA